MKRLRVKDKQSDTFRSLFCLSREITVYLLGFVPTQIRTRHMAHIDDFVCDIWICFSENENRGLCRTLLMTLIMF